MSKLDIIASIIKESEAYSSMSLIESYVDQGMELSLLPAQPLYLCIKSMPVEKAAKYLAHFTAAQRKVFYNLDLWDKDLPKPDHFNFWLKANFLNLDDNLRNEFVQSDEFLLFLKSRFNIWTFDVEDPMYPDHDNYFLTDDSLLLFEFEEGYEQVEEVRELIRHLYYLKGVEKAYAFLFKLVSESFMQNQEEMYQAKKEILRDYGFVDYFDALKYISPFANLAVMDNFIKKKAEATGEIDIIGKQQALHNKSLISFKDKIDFLQADLANVEDEKRLSFLQFNFIQLVNGTLALNDSLQSGPVAMTKTGETTRNTLELGYHYIKNLIGDTFDIFQRFEFEDLYRVGFSLLYYTKKDIKKALHNNGVEGDRPESFLGQVWVEFMDLTFDESPRFNKTLGQKDKPARIIQLEDYHVWKSQADTFVQLLPFFKKFFDTFIQLENDGILQDDYYVNYDVADIDFEAIILSSLGNFYLGNFQEGHGKKLGLNLKEFRKFAQFFTPNGKLARSSETTQVISDFLNAFGLNQVKGFEDYLFILLENHLEGYDYENLGDDDFKHVGGPIILASYQ